MLSVLAEGMVATGHCLMDVVPALKPVWYALLAMALRAKAAEDGPVLGIAETEGAIEVS
jgi:hypothetical protein